MVHPKNCLIGKEELPIISEVDVIVAGASVGGIAAALRARELGARVFVVSSKPYLGEDICGTYKYLYEPLEESHPLVQEIFINNASRTPFGIKKLLEDKLLDNSIDFLYSSFVSQVLQDEQGMFTGVVIANRSGRQVILAKGIIDATLNAQVTQLAGIDLQERAQTATGTFQLITVGNTSLEGKARRLPLSVPGKEDVPVWEYTVELPVSEWSYPAICGIEQTVRNQVWDPDQLDSADDLFFVPPYKIEGKDSWDRDSLELNELPNGICQPLKSMGLVVLGPCADVVHSAAADLARPDVSIPFGEKAAEALMEELAESRGAVGLKENNSANASLENLLPGEFRVASESFRPKMQERVVTVGETAVPVIGEYEVVVIGGGTAGANVGISAARQGVQALVIEYLHVLGGTQTAGYIGRYWDGYREGFTKEIDEGVRNMAPLDHPRQKKEYRTEWNFDWKAEWYRKELLQAGGTLWFGAIANGVYVQDGQVKGVLLATPQGAAVVLGKIIVDSTGSGDIAIAAGADYVYTGKELAVQGAGLPKVDLNDHYNNTDWTFIDDTDVVDVTRLFVEGKGKFSSVYDIGKLPQTRERRRIVGEYEVSVLDIVNHRRYADTISYHMSSFDTHGYTIDPFFTIKSPEQRHVIYEADVPLRSLLVPGIDNLIVTGLGVSAHRDAMPVIRMQPCLQNQGYSVGYLCALAIQEGCSIREVDIKKVQRHLVEKEILPERVLTDKDTPPVTEEELRAAVQTLPNNFEGLEKLLTQREKAHNLLLEAFKEAEEPQERQVYAQVLCMLGDAVGVEYVMEAVESFDEWDKGWHYTGMGQFGPCMSLLDSLIIALGESGDQRVLPVILKKAKQLTPDIEFSHFRAVCLALERLGSAEAVPVLVELLSQDGMGGHYTLTLAEARKKAIPNKEDVSKRNKELKEIHLARALYRCGDYQGMAKDILAKYANDLHGHYARHASFILTE